MEDKDKKQGKKLWKKGGMIAGCACGTIVILLLVMNTLRYAPVIYLKDWWQEHNRYRLRSLDAYSRDVMMIDGAQYRYLDMITLGEGYYSVDSVLTRAHFEHEGISMFFGDIKEDSPYYGMTNQERAKCIFEELMESGELLEDIMLIEYWESFADYSNRVYYDLQKTDYTQEEKIDMLCLVWCGEPYYENSQMSMQDMTSGEIMYIMNVVIQFSNNLHPVPDDLNLRYYMYNAPILTEISDEYRSEEE